MMFYAGDGVSDLSAAKETDLLFAKKGHGKQITRCLGEILTPTRSHHLL
jgi:2-hydroxy-3-keto-5-methylthiopentenyl-1-phosphate phosphatase